MRNTITCPFCENTDNRVIDTRKTNKNKGIRRRRECTRCHQRFTTYEYIVSSLPAKQAEGDPVVKLISSVNEALNIYANTEKLSRKDTASNLSNRQRSALKARLRLMLEKARTNEALDESSKV